MVQEKNRMEWSKSYVGELLIGEAAEVKPEEGEAKIVKLSSLTGEVCLGILLDRRLTLQALTPFSHLRKFA